MGPESERDPRLIVVCDTGPILHLHEAGLLELLPRAGRVIAPPRVHAEVLSVDPLPEWLGSAVLDEAPARVARAWIQSGVLHTAEAYALALAKQLQAHWFLTDDTAARLMAHQEGLEVHGSLGVVLWAAATGKLDRAEAETGLNDLWSSSLWISQKIFQQAQKALEHLYN